MSWSVALSYLLLLLQSRAGYSLQYDPSDYLEVYPDPTDPAVLRGRTPLHFALIQSLGGQYDGSGAVAGVKVALDRINDDSSILPGYTLHYTFADSQCDRTESLNVFFSQILREPTKMAVIGSGCSVATEPTAEISHYYNISHISCLSSSTALRNRLRFPSYFQLLTTEEIMAFGYYGVIQEYRWKRIAFIIQDETLFTVTINRLISLLDEDGEVDYNSKIFATIADLGDDIFNENSRIFLIATYASSARKILCEAYAGSILAPRHTFLTVAWYSREWWKVDTEDLPCTVEQRESVLLSTLAFLSSGFLDEKEDVNRTTDTGITAGEFLEEEKLFIGQPPLNLTDQNMRYSQYCYDATWTLAYALNNTLISIGDAALNAELSRAYNITPPFDLEDFTYESDRLLDVIFRYLESTSFNGVTGMVQFGDQGIRPPFELDVFQYRNSKSEDSSGTTNLDLDEIGNVVLLGEDEYVFVYGPDENIDTVWNGLVPYDGVPVKQIKTIHLSVTIIFVIFACAGITLAGACLIFNFRYRKSKLIKLASSQLNYLIGLGAVILYVDSVLFVIPSTDPLVVTVLCNITPWLTAIGYSLCYGTILTKMARVYYIFNNPSTNKKGIRDWMLILGVALLVAIDLTIIIIYMALEGVRGDLNAVPVPFTENVMDIQGEQDIITVYCVYICDSTPRNIFLGVLYGYKMVLQVIALILAFSIRKVKVRGLDDAKFIGASIYVTSIVLAVTIVGTFSLKEIINAFAALICTGFLIGTTVILVFVFVPLMVGLYKDPKGENIFKKASNMSPATMGLTMPPGEVDSLKKKVSELENELKEKQIVADATINPETADPRLRTESIASALQGSNMVSEQLKKGRTFSGTIWDTPDERGEIQSENNGTVQNGNWTPGDRITGNGSTEITSF